VLMYVMKQLLLCMACVVLAHPAIAQEPSIEQLELEAVKAKIGQLTQQLQDEQQQRDTDVRLLKETDEKISNQSAQLSRTREEITTVRLRTAELEEHLGPLREQLANQRQHLAQQVSASWRMGRQQFLKLLLKQDDPARLSRILTYYGYLNRARIGIIDEIRVSYEQLQELNLALATQSESLESHLAEQARLISLLQAARVEQQQIVDHWNSSIGTSQQQLAQLAKDAEDLNQLLASIDKAIPEEFRKLGDTGFAALKGRLVWPVSGKITRQFGEQLSGGVVLEGLVISLPEGEPVRSVHGGTVVFADWLRGYGMMVIVEHDSGFMTLYGYNQELLKHVGDKVDAGEIIGLSGRSGGQKKGSLYFAVRRGERAMNPTHWCRAVSKGKVG
jgi:septal ring factor EnvC (AmiA/AmiB activator)